MDREAVFDFLDVIFHAATLIVEAPQIHGHPIQIGHDRFVLPVGVQHESALAVFEHLCFANDGDTASLFPRRRFVDESNPFDDPVFIHITRPISAGLNFFGEPLRPFKLADIADSLTFPEAVEFFATKAFIEPGKLHFMLAEKFEGLLHEVGGVRRRMRVARPEDRIQIQAGLAFKGQKWMIAFTSGLVRIGALSCASLIAIHGLHGGIQIKNEIRQTVMRTAASQEATE